MLPTSIVTRSWAYDGPAEADKGSFCHWENNYSRRWACLCGPFWLVLLAFMVCLPGCSISPGLRLPAPDSASGSLLLDIVVWIIAISVVWCSCTSLFCTQKPKNTICRYLWTIGVNLPLSFPKKALEVRKKCFSRVLSACLFTSISEHWSKVLKHLF